MAAGRNANDQAMSLQRPHELTPELVSRFAGVVMAGVHREYPNKLDHVINSAAEVRSPRELHPAFFGCFDWHSAVHGHWLLARVLRLAPEVEEAAEIGAALSRSLTPERIAVEVAYLSRPNSGSFERTYGWAWLLKLAEELSRGARAGVEGAAAWLDALRPLAEEFERRYLAYLPKADYPIRTGVHPNSAFGLAFAHDYAAHFGRSDLRGLVERKARSHFLGDRDYPAHLEPSGSDFFSPALMEADLMRRVLPRHEFASWFAGFLPGAARGEPRSLFEPARVSDRTDLQIVHLDGLNLSRAWNLRNLAPLAGEEMTKAARLHIAAALPHVSSGNYAGEHWLATFALLALTDES
jgi:hypothetical protein